MVKELVTVGIFLIMTAASFAVLARLWRRTGRAGRVAAILGIAAAYCALTYLLSLWAARGGWPEGMFYMVTALFVAVPAVVVFAVLLIVASFGGSPRRRAGMIASFCVLVLIILAMAFNQYLRLAWYGKDIDNPDPRARAHAVLMAGGTRLRAAEPMVLSVVNDPSPEVRRNAVLALASIDDPETVGVVRDALSDEDPGVREMAVIAVVPLGRGGPEVVGDLKRMLSDPDTRVREAAEGGLDTLDPAWRAAPDVPEAYRTP